MCGGLLQLEAGNTSIPVLIKRAAVIVSRDAINAALSVYF